MSLLALRERTLGKETPRSLSTIMTYELGDLVKSLVYAEVRRDCEAAYLAEARIALADIITQTYILAEVLGADWQDLRLDGEERFRERMTELKAQ